MPSSVVTYIVPMTATPYADASALELWNASTNRITQTNRKPLAAGTKICPLASADVCSTRTRGNRSSWTASRVSENAPEMTACDAITVAAVDNSTRNDSVPSGASA